MVFSYSSPLATPCPRSSPNVALISSLPVCIFISLFFRVLSSFSFLLSSRCNFLLVNVRLRFRLFFSFHFVALRSVLSLSPLSFEASVVRRIPSPALQLVSSQPACVLRTQSHSFSDPWAAVYSFTAIPRGFELILPRILGLLGLLWDILARSYKK